MCASHGQSTGRQVPQGSLQTQTQPVAPQSRPPWQNTRLVFGNTANILFSIQVLINSQKSGLSPTWQVDKGGKMLISLDLKMGRRKTHCEMLLHYSIKTNPQTQHILSHELLVSCPLVARRCHSRWSSIKGTVCMSHICMSISPPLSRLWFKFQDGHFWVLQRHFRLRKGKIFSSKFLLLWINPKELHDAGSETLGIKGRVSIWLGDSHLPSTKCLVSWVLARFIRKTKLSTWSQSYPQPLLLSYNKALKEDSFFPTAGPGKPGGCRIATSGPSLIILSKSFIILLWSCLKIPVPYVITCVNTGF